MIEAPKAISNVALDDPGAAFPGVVDFSECRVASPAFAEAMRVFTEGLIEVGVQDHSHNLS